MSEIEQAAPSLPDAWNSAPAPASDGQEGPREYGGDSESIRSAAREVTERKAAAAAGVAWEEGVKNRVIERYAEEAAPDWSDDPNAKPPTKENVYDALKQHRAEREAALKGAVVEEELSAQRQSEQAEQAERQRVEYETATCQQAEQQAMAARQQAVAQATQGLTQAQRDLAALETGIANEFPELVGVPPQHAWQIINAMSPDRQQRVAQYMGAAKTTIDAGRYRQHEIAATRHEEFRAYAKSQDDQFESLLPADVRADPVKRMQLQNDAVDYLKTELKLSDDDIQRLWHGDPQFRSAGAQKLIFDAVQTRRQKNFNRHRDLAGHRVPPPAVQRPGTRNGGSGGSILDAARDRFERVTGSEGGTVRQQLDAALQLRKATRPQDRSSNGRFI